MNGTQSKSIEGIFWQFSLKRVFFQLALILLGFAFLFFITLMKAKGTAGFGFEPLLFVYTIFVTAFQLSRLVAAMFYNHAYRGAIPAKTENENNPNGKFEPLVTFVIPCKNEEAVIAETVREQEILGKVLFSVPYVGYAVARAKTPVGFLLIVIVPSVVIIYEEIRNIAAEVRKYWARRKKKRDFLEERISNISFDTEDNLPKNIQPERKPFAEVKRPRRL